MLRVLVRKPPVVIQKFNTLSKASFSANSSSPAFIPSVKQEVPQQFLDSEEQPSKKIPKASAEEGGADELDKDEDLEIPAFVRRKMK